MLNIIIYENDKNYMEKNVHAINMALVNYDIDYRINKFDSYSSEFAKFIYDRHTKKIYILNVGINDCFGLKIASRIRQYDWDSIIIFTNECNKCHNDIFYNRLLVLDFIFFNNQFEERLIDTIGVSVKNIYKQNIFVFKYNNFLYRIPYSNICFIEKEPLIKRCIIHTLNNKFYVVNSINALSEILGTDFFKTHQSCIVNMNNIKEIDLSNNIIFFENDESTSLLSEKMKKGLKEYIGLS